MPRLTVSDERRAIFRYVDADEDGALFVHNPSLQMRARARAAVRVWDCGGGDRTKLYLGLSSPGGRGLASTLSLAGLSDIQGGPSRDTT